MSIVKRFPDGALVFSDIINGQYISMVYMGYSKKEATSLFRDYIKKIKD